MIVAKLAVPGQFWMILIFLIYVMNTVIVSILNLVRNLVGAFATCITGC